ncbi:MAG: pilus assembly protein CpaF [Pseudonocardiales bacterium]|nr:pilus assembly protein CpaF [Pseudonocardiales bacterium]
MPDLVDRVRRRLVDGEDAADLGVLVGAENAGIADDRVLEALRRDVEAEVLGAGPLEPLLALRGVTDVLVNGPESVWIDRGGGLEPTAVRFADDDAIRRLAQRLAAQAGRRLDAAAPFVDAALADGTRLHAVLPPVVRHPTLSLRVLARERRSLADLALTGAMHPALAEVLRALVLARLPFVITGGAGSGKTTLLGALLSEAADRERIVLIEDAAELVVSRPHVVRMVTRSANVEGAGEVGPRDLVRNALRMRPDRLVIGEFRGAEMVDLLVALNTGHDGGAATMHANSAADVPARVAALGMLGGLRSDAVVALVASALDVVVHLRRERTGRRVVDELALLERDGDRLRAAPVWTARGTAPAASAARDRLAARVAGAGIAVPGLLR